MITQIRVIKYHPATPPYIGAAVRGRAFFSFHLFTPVLAEKEEENEKRLIIQSATDGGQLAN